MQWDTPQAEFRHTWCVDSPRRCPKGSSRPPALSSSGPWSQRTRPRLGRQVRRVRRARCQLGSALGSTRSSLCLSLARRASSSRELRREQREHLIEDGCEDLVNEFDQYLEARAASSGSTTLDYLKSAVSNVVSTLTGTEDVDASPETTGSGPSIAGASPHTFLEGDDASGTLPNGDRAGIVAPRPMHQSPNPISGSRSMPSLSPGVWGNSGGGGGGGSGGGGGFDSLSTSVVRGRDADSSSSSSSSSTSGASRTRSRTPTLRRRTRKEGSGDEDDEGGSGPTTPDPISASSAASSSSSSASSLSASTTLLGPGSVFSRSSVSTPASAGASSAGLGSSASSSALAALGTPLGRAASVGAAVVASVAALAASSGGGAGDRNLTATAAAAAAAAAAMTPSASAAVSATATPSGAASAVRRSLLPSTVDAPAFGLLYPALVGLTGIAAGLGVAYALDTTVGERVDGPDGYTGSGSEADRSYSYPLTGTALAGYLLFLLGGRAWENGGWSFFDAVWGCNVALAVASVGMLTGRPRLVAASVAVVGLDQTLWYVDVVGRVLKGRWGTPVGVSSYLNYPENRTLIRLITTWHHLFFLPLCMWTLRHHGGLKFSAWVLSAAITSAIVIVARAFIPKWVTIAPGQPPAYLNVNLSFEFWKDVKIGLLHLFDNRHPLLYLPYFILFGNIFLNGPPYLLLAGLSRLGRALAHLF